MNAPVSIENSKVWVAGHKGMVGSALVRRLERENCEILTVDRQGCDLTDRASTSRWLEGNRPDYVILAAARVGGILANDIYPVDFLLDNMRIQNNVIEASHDTGVRKMLFLGSSCIYPKMAPQPIAEEALLTGPLEPTNQWYAVAKIAGIKLCQAYRKQYGDNFISAMPTNLYGPHDNFDLQSSHVIPALMRKAHEAKQRGDAHLTVWGTGSPLREFLHVDDLADGCLHALKHYDDAEHINIGYGSDISIRELAELIVKVVGFDGELRFDASKPDGTPKKLMSNDKMKALGWEPKIPLEEGLSQTYQWYLHNH